MSKKKVIVKVQIPLSISSNPEALVYNKSQSIMFYTQITDELLALMKGQSKAFLYFQDEKLIGKAPWQEW